MFERVLSHQTLVPYYGINCQGQCYCDEERCDFSTGCINLTKGIVSDFTLV